VISSSRVLFLALGCASLAATAGYAQTGQESEGVPPPVADRVPAAADTALPENAFETRIVMESRLEAGDFAGALALAERLLDLATRESGAESQQVAEAHLLIGRIQRASGDYTGAETSILAAIDVYENSAGPVSTALIDPFLDLGDNYDEAGDYQGAISSYSEARTIGRRNYGLLNEQQIGIIDKMSEAAMQLGQLDEARNLQIEALTLAERNYGESSIEAIEARFKLAAWLRRQRLYDDERRLYFEIQRIVSREHGNDPVLIARTLRQRAESFREQDNGDALGLSGLRDAIELLEAMPEPPTLLLAELYLDAGDWSVEFSRAGASGSDYIEAWRLLGSVENGEALRREWFDELTVVEIGPVSRRGLSADPDAPAGYVEIRFTVDPNGRTRDVEVTDSYPPGFKDAVFLRQYRDARFRPRVENGQLVPTRRARRNEFNYDPAVAAEAGD
jgi:tetratricopeptide (TPR) repeat protein